MSSGAGLGVLDEDVEVAVVVEDAGVEQLELRLVLAAAAVLLDQPGVGKLALRILVEHLQVGVRRRGVEVVVELLHVLAVVALAVGQAEQALLEDRIAAVPQRQRQAQPLLVVADAGDAVLAPAIGAAARWSCGDSPRRCRRRCSPRAPCPTGARSGTAPSASRHVRCRASSARRGAPRLRMTRSSGAKDCLAIDFIVPSLSGLI